MRRFATAAMATATAAALFVLPFAAGCNGGVPSRNEGGPEMAYLTARPPVLRASASGPRALLPLMPGAVWDMAGSTMGPDGLRPDSASYTVRVVGPAPPASGASGTLVEIERGGKVWRREIYQSGPASLSLQAAAEEDHPWMVFSPAIPLVRYPLTEGQSLLWSGSFRYNGQTFPATAFNRVSAIEPVVTGQGTLLACRIDTQILVSMGDAAPLKFPTVRWLAPGVGFVRRGFMDSGKGVYTVLRRFHAAAASAAR